MFGTLAPFAPVGPFPPRDELLPALAELGVHLVPADRYTAEQKAFARTFFHQHVFAALTPLAAQLGLPALPQAKLASMMFLVVGAMSFLTLFAAREQSWCSTSGGRLTDRCMRASYMLTRGGGNARSANRPRPRHRVGHALDLVVDRGPARGAEAEGDATAAVAGAGERVALAFDGHVGARDPSAHAEGAAGARVGLTAVRYGRRSTW